MNKVRHFGQTVTLGRGYGQEDCQLGDSKTHCENTRPSPIRIYLWRMQRKTGA